MAEETESSNKDPKVGDKVKITKYKNNFGYGYTNSWSKEIFVMKPDPWTYKIKALNGETLTGRFYEK